MRCDLTGAETREGVRTWQRLRWVGVSLIVVFGAVGVWGVDRYYIVPLPLANLAVGLTPAIAFVGFGSFLLLTFRGAALSLDIGENGFAFEYPGGREWRGAWGDSALCLRLGRVAPSDGSPPRILLVGRFYERALLTRDAADVLVREASAHGFRVLESPPATRRNSIVRTTTITK